VSVVGSGAPPACNALVRKPQARSSRLILPILTRSAIARKPVQPLGQRQLAVAERYLAEHGRPEIERVRTQADDLAFADGSVDSVARSVQPPLDHQGGQGERECRQGTGDAHVFSSNRWGTFHPSVRVVAARG
jgi:hypothetical protein